MWVLLQSSALGCHRLIQEYETVWSGGWLTDAPACDVLSSDF